MAHSWSHARGFSPKRVVIHRSKTGFGGSTAHGRFLPSHVAESRPAFGTSSVANPTIGATNLFGHEFVVPPHCATRRWTMHANQSHRCLHPLGLGMVLLDGKRRVHFAHGRQGSYFFLLSPVTDRVFKACQSLNLQNITLRQARHSGPSIDRAMNVRPLNECKSHGQSRTNQSALRYEKSARLAADYLALPRQTRELIKTFVPLAEPSFEPAQALLAPASEAPVRISCSLQCCGQSHSSMSVSLLLNLQRRSQLGALTCVSCQRATRHQGSSHCMRSVDSSTRCFFARQ